jgi:RNA polymerase sigma-70 factor (ECF subfamily)
MGTSPGPAPELRQRMSHLDLDEHLPAIAAGDARAFGRWVAGCEHRLRASLSTFARQLDVEPVVQETLLRVWQIAPRFVPDGRPDGLVRLAVRIARNLAVSELRRQARAISPEAEAVAPAVEPDPLLRQLLLRCREELPRKPAAALGQRLGQGGHLPDRELAALVGMQLNTFLQNVGRARKLLAACLERQGVTLEDLST